MGAENGTERRRYVIAGELSPAHWDALMAHLGHTGLHIMIGPKYPAGEDETTLTRFTGLRAVPEAERPPTTLLNRADFLEFGKNDWPGRNRSLAGRAWSKLTNLYLYSQYPERYRDEYWYSPTDYEHIPLVFETETEDGCYDLRLDSLEVLAGMLEDAKKTDSVQRILGHQAGVTTARFIQDFTEYAREAETELETRSASA